MKTFDILFCWQKNILQMWHTLDLYLLHSMFDPKLSLFIWWVSAHVRPGPCLTLCRYIIRVRVQSIGMCVTHKVHLGHAIQGTGSGACEVQGNTQGTGWGACKVQGNTHGTGLGACKQAIYGGGHGRGD